MRFRKVLGQDRNDGFLRAMESQDDPARVDRPSAEELDHAAHLAAVCCSARWRQMPAAARRRLWCRGRRTGRDGRCRVNRGCRDEKSRGVAAARHGGGNGRQAFRRRSAKPTSAAPTNASVDGSGTRLAVALTETASTPAAVLVAPPLVPVLALSFRLKVSV